MKEEAKSVHGECCGGVQTVELAIARRRVEDSRDVVARNAIKESVNRRDRPRFCTQGSHTVSRQRGCTMLRVIVQWRHHGTVELEAGLYLVEHADDLGLTLDGERNQKDTGFRDSIGIIEAEFLDHLQVDEVVGLPVG